MRIFITCLAASLTLTAAAGMAEAKDRKGEIDLLSHSLGGQAAAEKPKKAGGARSAITCLHGTVRGGRCVCAPSAKRVRIGPNAWRCQAKTTPR